MKFLRDFLTRESIADGVLRTFSSSVDYRNMVEEFLVAFSNQNEALRKPS